VFIVKINPELNRRRKYELLHECRCDERLKVKRSALLVYTIIVYYKRYYGKSRVKENVFIGIIRDSTLK
jgi:predicted hydrolase (HD superfamily)